MLIDQRSEMVRQKLEKVDMNSDKQAFISTCGTGSEKPGLVLLCRIFCPVHSRFVITFGWHAFSALTLLVGRQEGHPACKKTEWWDAGVVVCLERGADLHMAQLIPLLLTVSWFGKIQIGFTFLVPAHLGSPGKRAVKWVCVCVCVWMTYTV